MTSYPTREINCQESRISSSFLNQPLPKSEDNTEGACNSAFPQVIRNWPKDEACWPSLMDWNDDSVLQCGGLSLEPPSPTMTIFGFPL